jgi:hypothetical protein
VCVCVCVCVMRVCDAYMCVMRICGMVAWFTNCCSCSYSFLAFSSSLSSYTADALRPHGNNSTLPHYTAEQRPPRGRVRRGIVRILAALLLDRRGAFQGGAPRRGPHHRHRKAAMTARGAVVGGSGEEAFGLFFCLLGTWVQVR